MVNRYYCNSSFNYWHFATKSYIDHKKESDNKQHTYNATNDVSKNYQQEVQNQSDNIKKQVEDAKMILKIK